MSILRCIHWSLVVLTLILLLGQVCGWGAVTIGKDWKLYYLSGKGDGDLDIMTAESTGDVLLFTNSGGSSFTRSVAGNLGASGIAVSPMAVGDFNEDGWPDVVASYHYYPSTSSGSIEILLNNHDDTFSRTSIHHSIGSIILGKATGDFNEDGYKDFAVIRYHGCRVYLYLGMPSHSLPRPSCLLMHIKIKSLFLAPCVVGTVHFHLLL